MSTWRDDTYSPTFWAVGFWEDDPPIPPLGDNSIPTGVKIDEYGATYTVTVSATFTGVAGDVIIEGTRYTFDGAMYITSDPP